MRIDYGAMGVKANVLQSLAGVDLSNFEIDYCDPAAFRKRLDSPPRGGIAALPLSYGGCSNMRFVPAADMASAPAQNVAAGLGRMTHFPWRPQFIYLIDEPCLIAPQTSSVFFLDGRILANTVYPSAGDLNVQRILGTGVTEVALTDAMKNAVEWPGTKVAALLYTRWSDVYFHAVTESLVHHYALVRLNLSSRLSYAVPANPKGSQKVVADQIDIDATAFNSLLVRAPRVVVSSLLYTHSVMGTDFLFASEQLRQRFFTAQLPLPENPWRKIYVSRVKARSRKMLNEGELVNELRKLGFVIVEAENLTFDEQAKQFRDAQIVVGPHGAGLINAVFARPDCKIVELRPLNRRGESPMWGTSYMKLSAIMGFSYTPHVSANEPDAEEWIADIAAIVALVKKRMGL